MPQVAIEYSAQLADRFDARAAALELHRVSAPLIGSDIGEFKTRLIALDVVIGEGADDQAMVHVDFRLMPGRTSDQKQAIEQAALTAVLDRLPAGDEKVQVTVEVTDLHAPHYSKQIVEPIDGW